MKEPPLRYIDSRPHMVMDKLYFLSFACEIVFCNLKDKGTSCFKKKCQRFNVIDSYIAHFLPFSTHFHANVTTLI
jgi:hypothetical protein